MFFEGLFKKAAADQDGSGHELTGTEAMNATPVKIGGHEFMPGDSQGYMAWLAKVKGTNEMIDLGDGTGALPTSAAGKKALIQAELQVVHGIDPATATKAANAATNTPPPPWVFKAKAAKAATADASDAPAAKATVKAGKAGMGEASKGAKGFRGPRGAVAT